MAESTDPKKSGSSKLLPALLGVNTLLIAGVIAVLFLRSPGAAVAKPAAPSESAAPKAEGEHAEKSEHGAEAAPAHGEKAEHGEKPVAASTNSQTLRLPDFVVHLRNPEADRYARITFEVQVATEADKAKVEARVPQVRDSFLSYLSDRTLEELRGSEGLASTKQALLEKMPGLVPGTKIEALYITDMVVQ